MCESVKAATPRTENVVRIALAPRREDLSRVASSEPGAIAPQLPLDEAIVGRSLADRAESQYKWPEDDWILERRPSSVVGGYSLEQGQERFGQRASTNLTRLLS